MGPIGPSPRPQRPAALHPYIDNRGLVQNLFSLGGLPHASQAARPRPMENWSLDDMREAAERSSGAMRRTVPDAMWLVFLNGRNNAPIEHGLRVPKAHLWWVASESDTVLLSDGVTHHYTSIGGIDRAAGTVSFVDPWGDEFFLQAGRNVLGIEAQRTTLSRDAFERVAVGILTWHTSELIDAYFSSFPEQAARVEQRLRAGHAILAVGPEPMARLAVPHFFEAARLADLAGDTSTALDGVAHAWLSAMCALAAATGARDPGVADAMGRMAELATRRAAVAELLPHLAPAALCRLANSAGQMGALPMVEAATAAAIARDADCSEAFRLRALARVRANPPAAVADARRALALNATESTRLEAELGRLEHPRFGGPTQYRLDRARHWRAETLRTLVAACANQGDNPGCLAAVRELCQYAPDEADSWTKRLHCEQLWGDRASLVDAAQSIRARDGLPVDLRAQAYSILNQP